METLEEIKLEPSKSTRPRVSIEEDKWNSLNDLELWSAFTRGNEGAFIKIYNDYFKELCDFGVQYAPISLIEDAVQNLFIDLRKRRDKLPKLQKSIRLFLFQCLKRRVFNMSKKNKIRCRGEVGEQQFGIIPPREDIIILDQVQKEKLEKLDRALAGLKEKHREAIYYYFYKGMAYEEVRDLLGFQDVKCARNLIYKVVGKLRKVF
ncbi:MAG TPA: RNA polymerase sigma factor [Pricia sp.]|nr:RNA polymerase sigma factor [Pricia sp.]